MTSGKFIWFCLHCKRIWPSFYAKLIQRCWFDFQIQHSRKWLILKARNVERKYCIMMDDDLLAMANFLIRQIGDVVIFVTSVELEQLLNLSMALWKFV